MPIDPYYAIKSPAFDIEHLNNYVLKIEISSEALRVAVFEEKSLLVLEEFNLEKTKQYPNISDEIKSIFDQHLFLRANYWSDIQIDIESPISFNIQTELFDHSQIKTYEAIFFPDKPGLNYTNFEISNTTYLAGYDQNMDAFFNEIYPLKNIEITCCTKKIMEYVRLRSNNDASIMYFSESHIYVFVVNEKKLKSMVFLIQDFDEKDFKNEAKNIQESLFYGKITTFHPLYSRLIQILPKASFGTLPSTFKSLTFSSEIPAYRYLSILI